MAGLAGTHSRLKSGGSSRVAAWGVGGGGDEGGGGLALRKAQSALGGYGPYQSLFSGEEWADGLPIDSHRVKSSRFAMYGW